MKAKRFFQTVLAGIVSAIFSYYALSSPAIRIALIIRRRMPDAWFESSILWCAEGVALGFSLVIAGIVCRIVYKHAGKSGSDGSYSDFRARR